LPFHFSVGKAKTETEVFPRFSLFLFQGTSSPEFFTNVIGTFVTESDLGIGTIIGTAVFNIFGVIAACGLFAGRKVPLEWCVFLFFRNGLAY
jgi:Ca2+/Na+ antiporter